MISLTRRIVAFAIILASRQFVNAVLNSVRMRSVAYEGSNSPRIGDVDSWHGILQNIYGNEIGSTFGYCIAVSTLDQECSQTISIDNGDEKGKLFVTFVDTRDNNRDVIEAAITGGIDNFQSITGTATVYPRGFGNYDYEFRYYYNQ